MTAEESVFYRRWIVANGWAEALGLGTTFVLGTLLAPSFDGQPSSATILVGAALAIVSGIVLEGVLVGLAQGRVLRTRISSVSLRAWTIATAIGAGAAWLIGMIPSTAMALATAPMAAAPPQEPGPLLQLLLAAALGAATGPILGVAQWVVLRQALGRAGAWLWANALAWALGMPTIFIGMDLVPWDGSLPGRALSIYATCLVAGLVVGVAHGYVLVRISRGLESP